nr:potassium-transporting ATPase subunit KdpC [Pseudonocardia acidicola]
MRLSWRRLLIAVRMLIVVTVLCGLLYPLAVAGVAGVFFSRQARGSLVDAQGRPVGSALLGQAFTDAQGAPLRQYFQPRPSAAGLAPGYDAMSSGASNLGPTNPELSTLIARRREAVAAFDGVPPQQVPPDAVTASGSGLDPDISPAYALEQADRVAAARGLDPGAVRALVLAHVRGRALGVLGEPRVNVLELNLALDGGAGR